MNIIFNNPPEKFLENGIYEIPMGVTEIGVAAFDQAEFSFEIKEIVIPDSVKKIDDHAFYDCFMGIEIIRLPLSVEHIGDQAFFALDGLKKVYINSQIKHMGKYAFVNMDDDFEIIFAKKEYYTPKLWHSEWNPHGKISFSE